MPTQTKKPVSKQTKASKPKRVKKEYRLLKMSPLTYLLKTGRNHDLIIQGEDGLPAAIRHCPNESSIFTKEQSEFAIVEPIMFKAGFLEIPANKFVTQIFMDNHPQNAANGGSTFEYIDEEGSARENIAIDETIVDIKYKIRQVAKLANGIHDLRRITAVINGSLSSVENMGVEELKELLYSYVDSDYRYFIDASGKVDIFDDDFIKRKYLTIRAVRAGIIKESTDRRSYMWVDNGKGIFTAAPGKDLDEAFADFLGTKQGALVAESIESKL